MRQSVQALCVVTLDLPADMATADIPARVADTVKNGYLSDDVTACEVRAVREEAAMFNNNEDQWTQGDESPWDLHKGGRHMMTVCVPYDYVTRTTPMKPGEAAAMVVEALNFMEGRPPADDAAKLRKALEMIRDVPACGNSDPDVMARALDTITAIVGNALGWDGEPKAVEPVMKCAECGNDGDDTLSIGIDGVWDAETGRWTLHYNGEGLDCSACDYRTRLDGSAFPDGIEISPNGRELLL